MEYKGHPKVDELSTHLKEESPRCAVIVAAALFDKCLAGLIGDTKDRSFSARIDDALQWGLLANSEHSDLHALRELRNDFAHDLRVKDFDTTTEAKVGAMKVWQIASVARPLDNVIRTTLDRLLFVVGVITFRLQKRTKPQSKLGPLLDPQITDWEAWPPVFSD